MPKKILFSCPIDLGSTGPGRPLNAIKDGLDRSGHDVHIIQMKEEMALGPQQDLFRATVFDLMHGYEMPQDWEPDIFLGVGGASLVQMDALSLPRLVPPGKPFLRTVTTWFSTHYRNAYHVLQEEGKKFNVSGAPIHPYLIWRAKKEQERTELMIVPSKYAQETYEQIPECKGKTRVAEFGVDCETFYPAEKPVEDLKVLFVGGNAIRKGLKYLMEAWQQIPSVYHRRLDVIGSGQFKAPGQIEGHGWVSDERVPAFYRDHSVFCLPSLEEGQALAVLEAMASGLPVIITRETGVDIQDGVQGYYVPARDPFAIATKLEYLAEHPKDREKMGHAAREYAKQRPWSFFGDRVVRILEEVA